MFQCFLSFYLFYCHIPFYSSAITCIVLTQHYAIFCSHCRHCHRTDQSIVNKSSEIRNVSCFCFGCCFPSRPKFVRQAKIMAIDAFRLPQDRIFLDAGALIAFNVTLKSHNLCLFFSVRIVSSRKLCNFECTLRVLSILSIKIRVAVVLFRFIHFHSLFVRSTFWACVCVHFSIRFVLCFFF